MNDQQLIELSGIVKTKNGDVLENITVIISNSPTPQPDIAAITNKAGEFSFGNLPKGNYSLKFISEEAIIEIDFLLEQTSNKNIFFFT